MLIWTEEFATGSELVAQQHLTLIENINKLKSLLGNKVPIRNLFQPLWI